MNDEQQDAIKILRAWHQIEFFQPYTTPDRDDKSWCALMSESELSRIANTDLPWLNANQARKLGINIHKPHKYILYLGVFNLSEFEELMSERLDTETLNSLENIELKERSDIESQTCFAKLEGLKRAELNLPDNPQESPSVTRNLESDSPNSIQPEINRPFLNSFCIEDIECVIRALSHDKCSRPLSQCLAEPSTKLADLYSADG